MRFLLLPLLLLAGCASVPPAPPPAHSDALWRLIERDCQGAQSPRGDCLQVRPAVDHRDVLVKDAHGHYQFLLMPLDKVSGIESPALYRRGAPNYFAAAWQARTRTEQALGQRLPRSIASLALNSPHGRSQHQLHIHVDCLRADVLMVPHHGSATSSTEPFLSLLQPAEAVVQAGRYNRYGHPHPRVMQRLQARVPHVVVSPSCGAYLRRSDEAQGQCWRQRSLAYWHPDRLQVVTRQAAVRP